MTQPETPRTSRARRSFPDAGPAILVGLALLFAFTPLSWPCPTATLFGVPCPMCGMTRATRLLLHGDVAGATHMHPLWPVILPAIAIAMMAEVVGYARTGAWGKARTLRASRPIAITIVALLVAVWVARFFGAFGGPVPVR